MRNGMLSDITGGKKSNTKDIKHLLPQRTDVFVSPSPHLSLSLSLLVKQY